MKNARLTYQPTSLSADAFYIAGMGVADAFVGVEYEGKFYAIASPLELGNFQKYSHCDEVFSLEELAQRKSSSVKGLDAVAYVIKALLRKLGARSVTIGQDAPVGLFQTLGKSVKVRVARGPLFPERQVKTSQQCREIVKANKGCAEAIAWVGQQIAAAKVEKRMLVLDKKPLTSESLRLGAQQVLLANGLKAADDIIIAGGRQGCDPHCMGSGKLKEGELIIVDIFAPLASSHYWGDMTRTFIKGSPSDAQAKLVKTVAKAQKDAIKAIRSGVDGQSVHRNIQRYFESSGYLTLQRQEGYVGFFHGTGHALGLEVHDLGEHSKRISKVSCKLEAGEVYTVEPGLYYPEIGGCRIEDNGVVTEEGFKLLSRLGYDWVV